LDRRGLVIADVEVSRLAVTLGGRRVLGDLDLQVASGTVCAIVGESGSGKTSLLRVIAGFVPVDQGAVRIDGMDQTDLAPAERKATLLFQEPRLFPALSVINNVSFGLRVRGVDAATRTAAATRLLTSVGLVERSDDRIDGLSGGEQQRVALARALCIQPEVLLLDEPFSAVDAPRRRELRALLRSLHHEHRHTMIFVTHDIADATAIADTVAVLVDGAVAQHGPVAEVLAAPVSNAVAALVGVDEARS
jgi:ABC-type Fe3+/spermidine/putrescine transport system ATPase subunit